MPLSDINFFNGEKYKAATAKHYKEKNNTRRVFRISYPLSFFADSLIAPPSHKFHEHKTFSSLQMCSASQTNKKKQTQKAREEKMFVTSCSQILQDFP